MHKKFDNKTIEKKWQDKWAESGIYNAGERDETKEKEYVLVELPYPSGNLHIGHWYAFAVPDIYVRFGRMNGKQMLYPMGFDAFGLPAENAAIKRNLNPKEWTEGNIEYMREQLGSMGASFSWDKTANTTDQSYYKWTQWMFTEFFKNDIAYKGCGVVNWCPGCNTVIANEQVVTNTEGDACERCDSPIEKKEMPQWMFRITNYADRLVDDLDTIEWPEHIKEAQRQWIGRSQGAGITFKLSTGDSVDVFTTRPDTLYGATYMVLAPEHDLISKYRGPTPVIQNIEEANKYVEASKKKAEQDRLDDTKEKTGVKLEGVTATNPASGEEIPVYIADYVLAGYGTGAIMAVPAHDERDHAFATKFGIEIKPVIRAVFGKLLPDAVPRVAATAFVYDPKTDEYLFIKSHEFNRIGKVFGGVDEGEEYSEAAIRETLEETGYKTKFIRYIGEETESHFYHPGKKVNRSLVSRCSLLEIVEDTPTEVNEDELKKQDPIWMKIEDAQKQITETREAYDISMLLNETLYTENGTVINSGEFDGMDSQEAKERIVDKVGGKMTDTYRLRDWSVGRQRYWGVPIPIVYDPEGKAHAVPKEHLPWVLPEDVDFTPTGESPLAKSVELKKRTEDIFGEGWTPEVETMDTFLDSSWYFLRYLDNENETCAVSLEKQKDWMPIDIYFGGAEHTTMHLLYSRFWQKALFDLGYVTEQEPYKRRINRSLILGPDGNKMSKSKGNVIDPDEQVKLVGADAVKMYLAFMGPYGEASNYPWDMGGVAGLRRFLERVYGLSEHVKEGESQEMTKLLHKTIQKVSVDIPAYKFNTAISSMMIFVNKAEKEGLSQDSYDLFLRILAPFAPHLTEELWEEGGNKGSIHAESFPEADKFLAKDDVVTIGVQINGKMRGTITIEPDATEEAAMELIKSDSVLSEKLKDGEIKKIIYVPGKIVNIVSV